jgi:hypothetical protein
MFNKKSQRQIQEEVPYKVIRIESWEEFIELVTDCYSNWAFRGQANKNWPLFSSLSRHLRSFQIHLKIWAGQEERILRIFKRKAHHFLSHIPAPDDDFEWLALMQHHGAPTRLLDFTWSPYVAAFFALEEAEGDAAVWALNPSRISYADRIRIKGERTIHPEQMNPRLGYNYKHYFLDGQIPFVWVGDPYIMNKRLVAQSGTFAMPGTLDEPIEDILSGYEDPENVLVKFILSRDHVRIKGMTELYRMNITYATLFPDLNGLAQSLAWELEFHWAYDPRTAEQYPDFRADRFSSPK